MTQMQVCPDLVRCNHLFFHGIRSCGDSNDRGVFSIYCVYTGIWLAGITYTSEQCTCQNSEHLFTVVAKVMPVPYISCKTQDTWHNCHMNPYGSMSWFLMGLTSPFEAVSSMTCWAWKLSFSFWDFGADLLDRFQVRLADVASLRPES